MKISLSVYEQYLYHCRRFMSDYHLSFVEIEEMPLELLLDLEVVDSKVEAAFNRSRAKKKNKDGKYIPFSGEGKFIDQIMNF